MAAPKLAMVMAFLLLTTLVVNVCASRAARKELGVDLGGIGVGIGAGIGLGLGGGGGSGSDSGSGSGSGFGVELRSGLIRWGPGLGQGPDPAQALDVVEDTVGGLAEVGDGATAKDVDMEEDMGGEMETELDDVSSLMSSTPCAAHLAELGADGGFDAVALSDEEALVEDMRQGSHHVVELLLLHVEEGVGHETRLSYLGNH
ncbi:hypothetical protein NL676_034452 [Syzygium grande]|nr:hypothetical protein NL676_034452 [Syzygium grande]